MTRGASRPGDASRGGDEERGRDVGRGSPGGDGSRGAAVRGVLSRAVREGLIPGAVFAGGQPGQPAEVVVAGDAQVRGGPRRPMHRDTLFDLASLTKVVATLPAVLRLAGLGELTLDDRVARFLRGFSGERRDEVTIRQLLAHTSGLPAEIEFWRRYSDPGEAARAMLRVPLGRPPGAAVIYSDVGYMLLGRLITAITGMTLEASVGELVTGPLAMNRTRFRPGPGPRANNAAATELQADGTALTGIVHDENARLFGGVAGHAGLFAPAGDLARYLERAWLGAALLSPATRREACGPQARGTGARRGLGWVLRGDQADPLGSRWPSTGVSHTGFTGTSLAFDPASGCWAVLLSNEVHFGRNRGVIRGVRESVHDCWAPR